MLLFFVVVSGVERAKELSFEGKNIARVRKSKTFSSSSPPHSPPTKKNTHLVALSPPMRRSTSRSLQIVFSEETRGRENSLKRVSSPPLSFFPLKNRGSRRQRRIGAAK